MQNKINPNAFIGQEVFKFRELLCSSHSGKGTGLECSECVRDVADERDRAKAENRILRNDTRSIVGWYWAMSEYEDEGWCGSFKTLDEAQGHVTECLEDGDDMDEAVSFIEVQMVTQPAGIPDPAAELTRLRGIEEDVKALIEGFNDGVFARDISRDAEPGWAMRMLGPISALTRLAKALGDGEKGA